MKLTIFQPSIPHYREEFFIRLAKKFPCEFFCYEKREMSNEKNFKTSNLKTNFITSFSIKNLFFYNPLPLLKRDSQILALMIDIKHITTWILLLTKFIHHKKIILWGHGISIRRFQTDEKKTLLPLKWLLSLADGVWFYTENEFTLWKNRLPKLNAIALNNTVSEIDKILNIPDISLCKKQMLREKYRISQSFIFIYCARFTANRRMDLMLEAIERLDKEKFGFIIIGAGSDKPDFTKYDNVYDFGGVYDFSKKTELFQIADIYFQPAWVGLSIVEAMAYGKPVFTLQRSSSVLQCVEFSYIKDGYNGKIFEETSQLIESINQVDVIEITRMGKNAKSFAQEKLLMVNMVKNAVSILKIN